MAANLPRYVQDLLPERHKMPMREFRDDLRTRCTSLSADKTREKRPAPLRGAGKREVIPIQIPGSYPFLSVENSNNTFKIRI